jgi:hypothetical protein
MLPHFLNQNLIANNVPQWTMDIPFGHKVVIGLEAANVVENHQE